MAFSRSEVVLSTDPERLRRSPPMPESVVESCIRITAERMGCTYQLAGDHHMLDCYMGYGCVCEPSTGGDPNLAREPRTPPRSQREWHDIFRGDDA